MLDYSEARDGRYIVLDGEPYQVISSLIFRKQQRKPVNQTKLKSVRTGKAMEKTFHQSDKIQEASISYADVVFLYRNDKKEEVWFSRPDNPKDRFMIPSQVVGNLTDYISENESVRAVWFENSEGKDEVIGFQMPIKVDLKVTEAPPNFKGDTATSGTKLVVLETGAKVTTPMFIEAGDIIQVNTGTGEYVLRVKKA